MKRLAWLAAAALVASSAGSVASAKGPGFRMQNEWRGGGMCVDVVNGGDYNNFVQLTPCGNYTGQHWFERRNGDGSIALTTEFRGAGMCLDVVNGGDYNNFVQLARCGNYSGQQWYQSGDGDGYVAMTTAFRGRDMCLDVVDDGVGEELRNFLWLAPCENVTGQAWRRSRN